MEVLSIYMYEDSIMKPTKQFQEGGEEREGMEI
jgi:hypothetical protein